MPTKKTKKNVSPKITIVIPVFTAHEITIPDACPECGADLTEAENLSVQINAAMTGSIAFVGDKIEVADSEATSEGDPCDVKCSECGHPFSEDIPDETIRAAVVKEMDSWASRRTAEGT